MSRRKKSQPRLEDNRVFEVWLAEDTHEHEGALSRTARRMGCSSQHVANVRDRKKEEHRLRELLREDIRYVEPKLNNALQYQQFYRLEYYLSSELLLLIDITYLIMFVSIPLILLTSIKAPALGLALSVPFVFYARETMRAGRYRREAFAERRGYDAWKEEVSATIKKS